MNRRCTLIGTVIAMLLGFGAWLWLQRALVEVKAINTAMAKAAASAIPLKTVVETPKSPAVVASANTNVTEATVAQPATDADLKSAVEDLIAALDSPDAGVFVQNYMAPAMLETAELAIDRRMPADTTPEKKAEMVQMLRQQMQQQMPQMIQQITQQVAQNPDEWKNFQKMGEAFKRAQNTTPIMNAVGDMATYNLETNGDPKMPKNLVMLLRDGKWTFDIGNTMMSMADTGQSQ